MSQKKSSLMRVLGGLGLAIGILICFLLGLSFHNAYTPLVDGLFVLGLILVMFSPVLISRADNREGGESNG